MNVKTKMLAIGIARRTGLWRLYLACREKVADWQISICRQRYERHLARLKGKRSDEKIRVLFIVSEIAKWKEQRLYEVMEQSGVFEPTVGLSAWNRQLEHLCSNEELQKVHLRAERFFDRLGDRHVRTVRVENGKRLFTDLSAFRPDIVFYTEPWGPCKKQDPWTVSKFALTLYVPYFTPNYGILEWDCQHIFHRQLYGFFALNEKWSEVYEKSLGSTPHSVRFIPAGHPALDFYGDRKPCAGVENIVIYAPHCSIPEPGNDKQLERYSTFDWNHKEILEYAKAHREVKWVFKPHPLLKEMVLKTGLMSEAELSDYFRQWGDIGLVCEDGDYQGLFIKSRAMITDCGSFLTEYGATGKPVIHLICADNKYEPIFLMKDLYDTYYKVRNFEEMYSVFKHVIEDGDDCRRDLRQAEARRAGILDSHSSSRIIECIKEMAGRSEPKAE